jgi:hypothetical protein
MKRFMASIGVAFCLAVGILGSAVATASAQTVSAPASDACYPSCPTTSTVPSVDPSTSPVTQVASIPTTTSQLAFTGSDVAGTIVIALLAVGGGIVLVRSARGRRHSS